MGIYLVCRKKIGSRVLISQPPGILGYGGAAAAPPKVHHDKDPKKKKVLRKESSKRKRERMGVEEDEEWKRGKEGKISPFISLRIIKSRPLDRA